MTGHPHSQPTTEDRVAAALNEVLLQYDYEFNPIFLNLLAQVAIRGRPPIRENDMTMRLKEDVVQVGSLFDGTPVYGYRYKGAAAYHIGLLAEDVEKITPAAVIEINGYKAVDYRAATETSRNIHKTVRRNVTP